MNLRKELSNSSKFLNQQSTVYHKSLYFANLSNFNWHYLPIYGIIPLPLNNTQSEKPTLKCTNCGSDLILMDSSTSQIGSNPSLVTKTIYHCSNGVCQEEAEQRDLKRQELKAERDLIQLNRKNKAALPAEPETVPATIPAAK